MATEQQKSDRSEYMRAWYLKNQARRQAYSREYQRRYRKAHPDHAKEAQARWRKRHPEKEQARQRATSLKKNYGISVAEYEALLASQSGVCAICGNPPGGRRLDTDHDHKTGRIRGLLCPNCNNGLGRFLDSPRLLELAKKYLDKFFALS